MQSSNRPASLFKRLFAKIIFWFSYPFVMTSYLLRRHAEMRRIVPRVWLSQGEILAKDLELYEAEKSLDYDFISDLAKVRDETISTIKKQIIVSMIIFLFLLSNYLSIKVDITLAGFSLKYGAGVPEGLILVSNLLSCYTLVLQGNCYLLDATIKAAIARETPAELRSIFLVKYFPHENVGGYTPFNLPHITPTKFTSKITIFTLKLFLILLVLATLTYISCNIFLLFHYLWFNANFGIWSYALLSFLLVCGICSLLYVVITRVRLPYLDYTVNHELELLEQVNAQQHRARLQQIYGRYNEIRREMIQRGYIKKV